MTTTFTTTQSDLQTCRVAIEADIGINTLADRLAGDVMNDVVAFRHVSASVSQDSCKCEID